MTPTFRNWQDADFESRQDLFKHCFPETSGTTVEGSEHYLWKFRQYPALHTPPAFEYVGDAGGVIVAYYAALPYSYRVDAEVRTAGMVCDVMTHPSARGQGLFTSIGRYATADMGGRGVDFVTGYPVRPEVLPGHLKIGWKVVARLPVWLRIIGTRSFLPRPLAWLARALDPAVYLLQCGLGSKVGYTTAILERDAFLASVASSDAYDRLLQAWMDAVPNALHKTKAFMEWRTGAPGTQYHFASLYYEGELVGCALARRSELRGINCLAVLDVMIHPTHAAGAATLHSALAALARSLRADAIACMCSREWAKRYRFRRSGYLRTPSTFSLIVKKLAESLDDEKVYDSGRWHTFWIDSDDL